MDERSGTEGGRGHQRAAVSTVYVMAVLINIIDATVVTVALPSIADAFGVPVGRMGGVTIGYLVAGSITIPVSGWLGDRFGARQVFAAAVAAFTAASAACGIAGGASALIGFRILQGLAAGLMLPVGLTLLYHVFPPVERARMSRLINIPIQFAPAIGPVLGGALVEHAGWRWIFWVNAPIGAVAVTMTLLTVRASSVTSSGRFDLAGFFCAAGGFAGFMYAVSTGAAQGWTAPTVVIPGLAGVALLTAAVIVELRVRAPMLSLRLLGIRSFRAANLITACSSASFLGGLFAFPIMLQSGLSHSPLDAGLLTFPEAAGVLAGVQMAGRLYARIGPRRLVAAGQLVVTGALIPLALIITAATHPLVPAMLMLMLGVGQAFTFLPIQASSFDHIATRDTGQASALSSVTRQAGSAIGVAIAATVITALAGPHTALPRDAPFRYALLACAAIAALGVLLAIGTLHDDDAASSRGLTPKQQC